MHTPGVIEASSFTDQIFFQKDLLSHSTYYMQLQMKLTMDSGRNEHEIEHVVLINSRLVIMWIIDGVVGQIFWIWLSISIRTLSWPYVWNICF